MPSDDERDNGYRTPQSRLTGLSIRAAASRRGGGDDNMQAHAELSNQMAFTRSIPASRFQLLTGRALSGFVVLFLLVDAAVKLVPPQAVIDISRELGYSGDSMFGIGVTLLACLAVYLIPQTATLGALLLTAYLGGAVATHVRVGSPLFSILFPTFVAAFVWGGLLLRKPSLRVLLPFRS